MRKSSGFTLAEVLITLGIIGVVAALTLPALIFSFQKKELVTSLKSTYTTLANAVQMATKDYDYPDTWTYYENNVSDSSWNFANKYLAPYLKNVKIYRSSKLYSCPNVTYKKLDKSVMECSSVVGFCGTCSSAQGSNMTQLFLANGAIAVVLTRRTGNDSMGYDSQHLELDIDVNGYRGPNTWGKDVFRLQMNKQGAYKLIGLQYKGMDRTRALEICKTGIYNCAGIIMMDGWKFADDYPW